MDLKRVFEGEKGKGRARVVPCLAFRGLKLYKTRILYNCVRWRWRVAVFRGGDRGEKNKKMRCAGVAERARRGVWWRGVGRRAGAGGSERGTARGGRAGRRRGRSASTRPYAGRGAERPITPRILAQNFFRKVRVGERRVKGEKRERLEV